MEKVVSTKKFAIVIGSGGPTGWMVGQDVSWLGCIQNHATHVLPLCPSKLHMLLTSGGACAGPSLPQGIKSV